MTDEEKKDWAIMLDIAKRNLSMPIEDKQFRAAQQVFIAADAELTRLRSFAAKGDKLCLAADAGQELADAITFNHRERIQLALSRWYSVRHFPTPCRHEEELKVARETIAGQEAERGMSYNEQDVYRIPPSPSMTGVMWRDAYFEKCAEVHRVQACAQEDLYANAAELTRLRGIAENEKGLLDIIKRDEAELKLLRALAERAEDVEGISDIIGRCALGEAYTVMDRGLFDEHSRAVSAHLKEGR